MIDVNWDLAPEGAEKIIQYNDTLTWAKDGYYWYIDSDKWEKDDCENENIVIALRPTQTKTVADAVEWAKGEWNAASYQYIVYNPSLDRFDYSKTGDINDKWCKVCTRAEFEAYVKEQEGEKWTHETNSGYKCKILVKEPDSNGVIIVLTSDGEYKRHDSKTLKPIKPTISESDAKALEVFANKSHRHGVAWAVKEYLNGHDII